MLIHNDNNYPEFIKNENKPIKIRGGGEKNMENPKIVSGIHAHVS